ncbi:MAG: sulfatase-like hydrolase/transferase [Candidatus Omnitrophica bacterium]|nr:sulfatase-like hydrolase/transferase [Candidatus Omnitrophota bacterium]
MEKKPNIIMITVDMVRSDKRSCSPVFSEIQRDGVLFSGMITHAPYTIASLHAIFSGMLGSQTGVDAYYKSVKFDNKNCRTLPAHLKENGYYTAADLMSPLTAPSQGLDEVLVHDEHKDDLLERHSSILARLKKDCADRPFFVYLHYSYIHREIVKNVIRKFGDFDEKYFNNQKLNEKNYEQYVKKAGEYVAGIISEAGKLGLYKNDLFVILTDHGCSVGEKPGEKAYGIYTYDYTLRVWCYFVYPARLPVGLEIETQVRTIDIAPTIMDIVNISPNEGNKRMTGKSLLPVINGQDTLDREAYVETAGLDGPYPSPYEPNIFCVRTKKWKLVYNSATDKRELYDMEKDKEEKTNLSGKFPEIEEELFKRIKQRGL